MDANGNIVNENGDDFPDAFHEVGGPTGCKQAELDDLRNMFKKDGTYPNGINEMGDTDDDGDGFPDVKEQDDDGNDIVVGTAVCRITKDCDNDGLNDNLDAFPNDPCASVDTDEDDKPNEFHTVDDGTGCTQELLDISKSTLTEDLNDDNDNRLDEFDAFATDPCASVDTDGDGLPDAYHEVSLATTCDTIKILNKSRDIYAKIARDKGNSDAIDDKGDKDDDNDSFPDLMDDFPLDVCASVNTDKDTPDADNQLDKLPDDLHTTANVPLCTAELLAVHAVADADDDNDGLPDAHILEQLTFDVAGAPVSCSLRLDCDEDGTSDDTDRDINGNDLVEITTVLELEELRTNLSGPTGFTGCTSCTGWELMEDISLADPPVPDKDNWVPIGSCPTLGDFNKCTVKDALFDAIFDGKGHEISNLTITNPTGNYANAAGLFGAISSTAVLRNVHLRFANISAGGENVGLLVGYANEANISNSSAVGNVAATGDYIGGLVGDGYGANITSSYASGENVSGNGDYVGGLVGNGNDAIITSSYASGGNVSGKNSVGGLVGDGSGGAKIISSYAAAGSVRGTGDYVGGLVGDGRGFAAIASSYAAAGSVSGNDNIGGLLGSGQGATIILSYAAGGSISGNDNIGGLVGSGNTFISIYNSYWDSAAKQTVDGTVRAPIGKRGIGNNTGATEGLTGTDFKAIMGTYPNLRKISIVTTTEATCVVLRGMWTVINAGADTGTCANYVNPWRLGSNSQYPGLLIGECVHRPVGTGEGDSAGFTIENDQDCPGASSP